MKIALLFIASFLVAIPTAATLSCLPCGSVQCPTPVNCNGGTVLGICGCCRKCAKVEGEACGGHWEEIGRCDSGLACVVRNGQSKADVGICEPAVCKGKKCEFREVCALGNDGFPVCSCPQTCGSYRHKPVCGYSNGKQYNNECELKREECTSGHVIGVMKGPCKKCYHEGRRYSFGETRRGKNPCHKCNCVHGEWKCHKTAQCEQQKPQTCTVVTDSFGRRTQSDCPKGFWCKVQIPGIPDAGIPEVAVCVPEKSTVGELTTLATVAPTVTASRSQGRLPAECQQPASEGPCRAAFLRWYYNVKKGRCMQFWFGGCSGNSNNFQTIGACQSFCMRRTKSFLPVVEHTSPTQERRADGPVSPLTSTTVLSLSSTTSAPVTSEKRRRTKPTMVHRTRKAPIAKCHDKPSNKFYGEAETWEPNDCTVCVCRNGTPECLATVCRHPDCKEPLYIKGQCCPVCPLIDPSTSDHNEAAILKAFAENKLDTVLVSINRGGKRDGCRDIRSGQYYLIGQSWQLDQCTTCYCGKSGKAACAVQMCERDPKCKDLLIDNSHCCPKCRDEDVVKSTTKCFDTVTGKYYREAELWQRDECTSCYCGKDRKPVCTETVCPPVFCKAPMKVEQRCCPVCPDNIQQGCMYDGQRFLHGDFKLLLDKCTLCTCDNGDWHCTRDRCVGQMQVQEDGGQK